VLSTGTGTLACVMCAGTVGCPGDAAPAQVRYLEAVDAMARQLLARLAAAEAAGRGRFAVCVTGDHSTPVVYGDHSHEPVPLALARVRCAPLAGTDLTGRSPSAAAPVASQCPALRLRPATCLAS